MEILVLRRQLQVFQKTQPRPRLMNGFRIYWVVLRRIWPRWKEACVLVQPATVIGWHRAGFRLFWRWKSRPRRKLGALAEIKTLIRRIASENPRWGAPRIHGEILKLGLWVSERTISRHMLKRHPQGEDLVRRRQTWKAFLQNHRDVIAAMDFVVVASWNFKPLYVLIILEYGRRVVRHFNVTAHPEWVKQQLREAFPFDEGPRYLIHDRDTFGFAKAFLATMGIKTKLTAFHCPWQNGAVERMNGTLRRELLDHIIPLGEGHLRQQIKDYVRYYNQDRSHLGLNKDSPGIRLMEPRPSPAASVEGLPRCGGLHHRYRWRDAA